MCRKGRLPADWMVLILIIMMMALCGRLSWALLRCNPDTHKQQLISEP